MRAEILETARRLLEEEGYFAFSLRQVAREAGVDSREIGRRFGNRKGLLAAAMTEAAAG